jgi:(E)-4-hydroxy-3-methylbut-2-enyl-diphosphate synthase
MHGEVIRTVPEHEIVPTIVEEAHRLAAEMSDSGEPVVSVS